MNTFKPMFPGHQGSVLIDALIATVVLAGGMAAVVALNTRLVADASLAKHHAQAIALAQDKLEELRTNLINDDRSASASANNFAKLSGGSDACGSTTYPCGSAGFARTWTVANHAGIPGSAAKDIRVNVTWQDGDGEARQVTVSSMLSWDNPLLQSQAKDDDDFSGTESITPPTGGGRLNLSVVPDDLVNATPVRSAPDFNLQVVQYGEGVAVFDPTDTGHQVWLTTDPGVIEILGKIHLGHTAPATPPLSEPNNFTNNPALSSKAYFFDANTKDTDYTGLRSIAADAGICSERLIDPNNNNNDTSNANRYNEDYLEFLCYVGSRWYGRIGVMVVKDDNRNNALDGMMVNIKDYASGNNADQLCPPTYRYGSTCQVTGTFTISWNDEDGPKSIEYCTEINDSVNPDFAVIDVDENNINTITGEPMFLGTLSNQNFVVQKSTEACQGGYTISGAVTLTGTDPDRGIVTNGIFATASGTGVCGAVLEESGSLSEPDSDPTTGYYSCVVPNNWTGSITFNGANCLGTPVTSSHTNVTANVSRNVSISGCFGSPFAIRGTVANLDQAFNPVAVFRDDSGNIVNAVTCNLSATNYECTGIPPGTTGKVVLTTGSSGSFVNCGSIQTATQTFAADAVEDVSFNSCSPVVYEISGTVTKSSNKWESGTGGNKVAVTEIRVQGSHPGNNAVTCTVNGQSHVANPADRTDSYPYTCTVSSYPNQSVTLTARACGMKAGTAYCMTTTPLGVTLQHVNPISAQTLGVSP